MKTYICPTHNCNCLFYNEETGLCDMLNPDYYCDSYCDAYGIPKENRYKDHDDEQEEE